MRLFPAALGAAFLLPAATLAQQCAPAPLAKRALDELGFMRAYEGKDTDGDGVAIYLHPDGRWVLVWQPLGAGGAVACLGPRGPTLAPASRAEPGRES